MSAQAQHLDQTPAARRPRASQRRAGVCLLTSIGACLGLLSLRPQAPALVWNFTPSLPVGLYRVLPDKPAKGDIVALIPAGVARETLNAYGVLPAGRLLLKQLSAVEGDAVCRVAVSITINGVEAATARQRSRDGRELPAWSGCRTLGMDEIFLLAPHPDSFDSRYFGPVSASTVAGVATPLLTFPAEGQS